jgi:hypothetical protein
VLVTEYKGEHLLVANEDHTMAKSPKRRSTNMSNDALAALGLDDDAPVAATAAPAEAVAEAASAEREEVDVGDIEVGFIDFIPASKRTSGGSKYKFDSLAAPALNAAGKTAYGFFRVSLQPGVDEAKLKRSVQSATTQANKQAKNGGSDAYYVTRAENGTDGKFKSILVIRTDARPEVEEDEAASA